MMCIYLKVSSDVFFFSFSMPVAVIVATSPTILKKGICGASCEQMKYTC